MKRSALALAALLLALPLAAAAATPPQEIQEAMKLFNAGDLAGAAQKLEPLRRAGDAPPPALSLLGAIYLQMNRPQEALAVLKPLADAPEADPAVLYNASRAALALKQNSAWINYLGRAARLAPSSPAARDLGLVRMRQGKVVQAYSLLRPWAVGNPGDHEVRVAAASLALQLERPQEAEELLLEQSQDDPAIRLLRGRIQTAKGDGAGAVALLEPLLAKHPQGMDLELRRALAEAYLAAQRPAEAAKMLAGKTGNHPALVLLLGRAQHRAGNAAAALATLKPFADKLPADRSAVGDPRPAAGIAVEYGALLAETGHTAEALPVLEKATRLYPNSREAWESLGRALDAAGRKDEAAKARTQAQQLALATQRPAGRPAPRAAAQPPAAAGAPAAARADAAVSPDLQEAMRLIGEGKGEPALAAVRRDMAKNPGSPQAKALEIRLLLMMGRIDDALKITEAALKREPGNADLVYQHGIEQMARKDLPAAEKDLRHALQINPYFSPLHAPEARALVEAHQ